MDTHRRISNSEVTTWLACQAQYRYAFDLKLEKIPTGKSALQIGIAAHDAFKAYNRERVAGGNHDDGLAAADKWLAAQFSKDSGNFGNIFQARKLVSVYYAHYGDEMDKRRIIDAEREVVLPMDDQYSMPLKYDLYYQDMETGKYILSDYKTTYDFWSVNRVRLSPQFAKYFAAFRYNGMPVDECRLDQIRTRWVKVGERTFDELFNRVTVHPSKGKMRGVLKQHILAAQRITEFRALPPEIRKEVALPTMAWHVCNMCPFQDICAVEVEGNDASLIIETQYRANSYDYNKTDDMEKM